MIKLIFYIEERGGEVFIENKSNDCVDATPAERSWVDKIKEPLRTTAPEIYTGTEMCVIGRWYEPNDSPPWRYQLSRQWPTRRDKRIRTLSLTENQLVFSIRSEALIAAINFQNRLEKLKPKFEIGDMIQNT